MKFLRELSDETLYYVFNKSINRLTLKELEAEKEIINYYILNNLNKYNKEFRLEALEYLIDKRKSNGY